MIFHCRIFNAKARIVELQKVGAFTSSFGEHLAIDRFQVQAVVLLRVECVQAEAITP